MQSAALPLDETRRLQVLQGLGLQDAGADPVLDGLVRSAARGTGCPVALISLVERDHLWCKAGHGMKPTQVSREVSFCGHAIVADGLLEVADTTADPRFADNPLVTGEPHVRAYAGLALRVDGQPVGTLCVIHHRPHQLSPEQREHLADMARAAEHWLLSQRERSDLREIESYRHNLFDQMGDGVLLLDTGYRPLDANPSALSMLGYAREELPALRLHDLVTQAEQERLPTTASALAEVLPQLTLWQARRKDGSRFPAEVSVRPVDGRRYVAVLRDISARHAQDRQLRQLSAAVAQSSESILITDADACICYVNEAACQISGYGADELIGRNPSLLQSGQTPAATFTEMWARLDAGQPWKGHLFNRSKQGREYVEFAVITPIRLPHGGARQYLAVMEDVTEKRRMGQELDRHRLHLEDLVATRTAELERARRAAETANEAKSAFLAAMSHEIRTPMNGVLGIVDVLRQSSLTPYQAELAGTIRESAFALLGIIDDILDFSKIEARQLVLNTEPVALRRLVEAVCDTLQPIAVSRDVELQVFVDPLLPERVSSDPMRLRQILNNLLGNAIKFSAGQGRRGQVRLRVEPDGEGRMRLRVADNGIGMTPAAQASIFDPFVQAERTTSRRFGGTGLGLSICRRLVELFDGQIEVDSAPDQGSTFTVTLPLQAEANDAKWDDAGTAPDLAGLVCHVSLRDIQQARDWCAYLSAAGAVAHAWPSLAALQRALAANGGAQPLLVVEAAQIDAGGELPAGRDGQPLPLVRIGRGARRQARLDAPRQVVLDAHGVHAAELQQAVALAAGRMLPCSSAGDRGPVAGEHEAPGVEQAAVLGRLVLVAEDNEINRTVIRHQLALMGYAAEIADDGADALARWRAGRAAQRHGLLLTDLYMPELDGCALARALRAEEGEGERLPIVALTANSAHQDIQGCRLAGMDDFLAKPVLLEDLGAMLARWLPARPDGAAPSVVHPAPPPAALPPVPLGPAVAAVLVVDDEETERIVMERRLDRMGAPPVTACASGTDALDWLQARDTSSMLLLLDLNMPDMDGVEFMRHLAEREYSGAVALVSGADVRVLETASKLAEAYQLNVLSHLRKPVPEDTLRELIQRWRGASPVARRVQDKVYAPQALRQAIERGELIVHYQPKVTLPDGRWVGVEALVRWQHPEDGLLPPAAFIEIAESHGLIDELTREVMSQALAQVRRWRAEGIGITVAVNTSMDSLARLDFPEFVLAQAARHGVSADELLLEVTESRLMRDARATMDILTRLRLKKIRLSIDDFGTGHSSLSQLRDMPFDEMKIDRSFVHGSDRQPTQRAIFDASLDMAHRLDMVAVADGVEDGADWDFVRAAGCDVAQGYFIARPMPAEALAAWARDWQLRTDWK